MNAARKSCATAAMAIVWCWIVCQCLFSSRAEAAAPNDASATPQRLPTITDKTLVARVYLANTTQQGGSVLTADNRAGAFDAIVFGELSPGKWMAGSDVWQRTEREQEAYAIETVGPDTLVRIAVVYQGQRIISYHGGRKYADCPNRFLLSACS